MGFLPGRDRVGTKTEKMRDLHVSHTVTGLYRGLEHLKIETMLIGERFENVKDENVI